MQVAAEGAPERPELQAPLGRDLQQRLHPPPGQDEGQGVRALAHRRRSLQVERIANSASRTTYREQRTATFPAFSGCFLIFSRVFSCSQQLREEVPEGLAPQRPPPAAPLSHPKGQGGQFKPNKPLLH